MADELILDTFDHDHVEAWGLRCAHCDERLPHVVVAAVHVGQVVDLDGDPFGTVAVSPGRVLHRCEWVADADVERVSADALRWDRFERTVLG